MRHLITRSVKTLVLGTAAVIALSAPAFAGQGQAYPLPGIPSANASCVGSGLAFAAHYGAEGSSFPEVQHGAVGPEISADATERPGAVGDFNRTLAQSHGDISTCLP
ncbi:MAG TPA: hypothetical protein VMZ73_02060 [Acidimicrobiales bacterium]|nr:hypothetical protein [Acidimicrobiales bacterium]